MEPHYYFFNSVELSNKIYGYCSNWNDKFQFALLNRQALGIAFSQKSNLVYNVVSDRELSLVHHLPITTATSIRLNKMPGIENAFFHELFNKNRMCTSVFINIDHDLTIQTIEKVCKICTKKNVDLQVTASTQKRIFEDLITKFQIKYKQQFETYAANQSLRITSSLTRKRKEAEVIEAPLDPIKRLKFFVLEANKILQGNHASICINNDNGDLIVPTGLSKVLNYDSKYKLYNKDMTEAGLKTSLLTMNKEDLNKSVSGVVNLFIDSIIRFEKLNFYITSADVFIHNHCSIDDCAYGLDQNEYHSTPYAAVKENTYMRSSSFYELSIYWGFYELLITGGYYVKSNEQPQPFLGSSIVDWQFGEMNTTELYVIDKEDELKIAAMERLLNQYRKRDSHRLWGFHSIKSYVKGFAPVSPLHYIDHVSQKNRPQNLHHFASKLLYVSTAPQQVNKDDMTGLFLFFASSKMFIDTCNKAKEYAINFTEFKQILDKQSSTPVYLKFLVSVATMAETKVNELEACYLFSAFPDIDINKTVLSIMKDGLKGDITRQTAEIVKARKRKLRC